MQKIQHDLKATNLAMILVLHTIEEKIWGNGRLEARATNLQSFPGPCTYVY